MSKSIKDLIEIYEQELKGLLGKQKKDGASVSVSQIPEPKQGDKVKFENQEFKISSIQKFSNLSDTKSIDDFLNDKDNEIINDIEKEIANSNNKKSALNNNDKVEYDDNPYADGDIDADVDWEIDDQDDIIDIVREKGAEIDYDLVDVKWNDTRETTIAYYKSFHNSGPAFGIYYKIDGLKIKTKSVYKFCVSQGYKLSIKQVYIIAKTMTQYHEIYHHKIEAMSSRIEVITREPIYNSGFSHWYKSTKNKFNCYEETFANCYCYFKTKNELRKYLNHKALHNIMVHWFNQQPLPYKQAIYLINKDESVYREKENKFFEIILKKFYPGNAKYGNSNVWSLFSHGTQPYINVNSNVYYIIP